MISKTPHLHCSACIYCIAWHNRATVLCLCTSLLDTHCNACIFIISRVCACVRALIVCLQKSNPTPKYVYVYLFNIVVFQPFISNRLSVVGSRGQQLQLGAPDIPLPSNISNFLPGDPKAFPSQRGDVIPPSGPWSAPGSFPSGMQQGRP